MGPKNSANAYEEVRKQRLEENKKRMEVSNHKAFGIFLLFCLECYERIGECRSWTL